MTGNKYSAKKAQAVVFALVSEKAFQQQVEDLARLLKWKVYHTRDSRRSEPGFPDLILLRNGIMLVAELKREGKKPTAKQNEWLREFGKLPAQVITRVWYPSDIEAIERLLR